MQAKRLGALISSLIPLALGLPTASAADAKAKVTYAEQVSQIFKTRCNTCHNADKQKGGLTLETYSGTLQGGGSGKVIEPSDPDGSTLLQLVMHKDEPKMPPNSPKIPDAEIDVIRAWIESGALETSGSVAMVKAKPKFEFKLDPSAMGKPVGPPAMPENLLTEPIVLSPRSSAVVAMASSPWAPLVAIGGHKQIIIYNSTNNHLSAVLPFPEGSVNVLKFSRNGSLLLAGGGRGGESGLAVVWDVKTGKRVFEIGKEYDAVLAADISPDHGMVALGGPSKIVRVYNTADGQLLFELKKHTEWITALEFSPDGVLLATGDRNNGLIVWEAQTAREFFDLRGHTAAITDITWRLDSNVVASASEDGSIKLWEMENGGQIKTWGAHGGGVASSRFAKDGRILTTGRDRVTRLWDQNGTKLRDFEAFGDLALEAVFSHDETRVIAGDWTGEVRVFALNDGKRLANLLANPAPIATRLELAKKALIEAQAAADAAAKAYAPLQVAAAEKAAAQDKATQALAGATQQAAQLKSAGDQAVQLYQAKLAEEKAAADALKVAQAATQKAIAGRLAAEKAVPEKAAAEKAAADALSASKAAIDAPLAMKLEQDKALAAAAVLLKAATTKPAADQAAAELAKQALRSHELTVALGQTGARQAAAQTLWEQTVAEKANAPKLLEQAIAQAKAAEEASKASEAKALATAPPKATAEKALADARAAQKAAETLAATKKAELDQALAARAAADKVLASAKPAVDSALAAVSALKTETDALAVEKIHLDSTKQAMAGSPAKSS